MKNLVVRTISGLILSVVVLGGVLWSQWSFGAVLALILIFGMCEFYAMSAREGISPQRIIGIVTGLLHFGICFVLTSQEMPVSVMLKYVGLAFVSLILMISLMFICELYRKNANPAASVGVTLLGVFYVALPLSLMLFMPVFISSMFVVAYIVTIWANDVFAYLVGMTIGRHKLFERISPKKSWEGFIGGIVGAVAFSLLTVHMMLGQSVTMAVSLAVIVSVTGVLGDLAESMLKRAAGVKDSGCVIPGHGGILDRFDAMLLSAPFVFAYIIITL